METGLSQRGRVTMEVRLRYPFLMMLLLALRVLPLSATAPVPRQSPDLQFLDSSDNQIREQRGERRDGVDQVRAQSALL